MGISVNELRNKTYGLLAVVGKALSSPIRLELLDILSQGPRTVESLSKEVRQSIANTSQHLQVLRSARLIDAQRNGVFITYEIADQQVLVLASALRRIGELRLAEIQEFTRLFLAEQGLMERVSGETLVRRIRRGEVTLLDVRPTREYEAGHIPGALSVPLEELKDYISRLPKNREVVAYCRGPLCVMSIEAVKLLRKSGFRAVRWEESVADWVARGHSLRTGRAA
jgi:rhodanese-related sulfurtransferase/DNA-binding transcriptional ArsR family regulator